MRTATAVIVTHNSEDVLGACVTALAEFAPSFDRIVVDNASTDRTVEIGCGPGTRVISNPENRGFAAAVNQGFAATDAAAVLVLNPDVRVSAALDPLVEACMTHGIAAGQLVNGDGSPQAGFSIRRFPTPGVLILELLGINRLWPGNSWNRKYRCLDWDLRQDGFVDQPAGAFLMVRRDVWRTLGEFDESFHPVWFEDVDFCRRAVSAGFRPYYVAAAKAVHLGGRSVRKLDRSQRELYWYVSLIQYARKHFQTGSFRAVCAAAVVSTVPRMVLGMVREGGPRPFFSSLRILKYAGRRLVSLEAPAQRKQ